MARYYKKSILFIIPLLFIFICYDVNAATLTSYSSNYDSCSASNKFTFTNIDTMGNWNYFTGTIGSVISNVPNSMQFDFKYDLSAMKYYDVKFTMTSYDIYSSVNSSMVSISNGSFCGDLSNNNVALVSFTKSSVSSSQYKVMTFRIYSATAVSNWSILLENTSPIAGPNNFGVSSITINEVDMSNTDAILNNQNSNTDSIINNNNSNTNDIINNQNQNNEELKDTIDKNFNSCVPSKNLFNPASFTPFNEFTNVSLIDNGINVNVSGGASSWTGAIYEFYVIPNELYTISFDYSQINTPTNIALAIDNASTSTSIKEIILNQQNGHVSWSFTSPSSHIKISLWSSYGGSINTSCNFTNIQLEKGSETAFEEYGKEVCNNKLDDVNSGLNDINGSINNGNVDDDVGKGFFDGFNNEDFGLSDIITIPLNTINSLTSKTCQPLSIPIPKTNRNINLPCMTQVYQNNIPSIFTIWQVVSFGIIAYFIAIDIFHLVKGFKDPESDKVEVLDL